MFHILRRTLVLAAFLCTASAQAEMTAAQFDSTLTFQQGQIGLPGNKAALTLPDSFRYLNQQDTEKVLVGWGNPPGSPTLGMIVPALTSVMSKEGWGVIITYEGDGHVSDEEADTIDYAKLLKDMQEQMQENNGARVKEGYPAMHLIGWAEPPTYDKAARKMIWAQQLRTDDSPQGVLNYNIRVLGREGVLVLNAVAHIDQLAAVRTEMRKIAGFSDFTAGNRYADYNPATDKAAGYGLAALVAGGAAAKMGFFGKLLALLLAFKKLLIVGIGVAVMGLWNFMRGRSGKVNLDK